MDETAFNTAELFDEVIARKGRKQIPSQFDGTEKECVSVLPCENAAGLQLKFMALYSGVVHVQSRSDDTHGMCYHAVNSCGYMDEKHFAEYIRKEVFPAMTDNKVGRHCIARANIRTLANFPKLCYVTVIESGIHLQ